MARYTVFMIIPNRSAATEKEDDNKIEEEPVYQRILRDYIAWIQAEIKADRLNNAEFLLDSSKETNLRISFDNPQVEKNEDGSTNPTLDASVAPGHQISATTNILCYFTVEYSTIEDVAAWAKTCPISYDGFAFEIRELQIPEQSISEAPAEIKEWAGDQIVSKRKQLLEEGKLRKDENGTLWFKIEDKEEIKEIVAQAEERGA